MSKLYIAMIAFSDDFAEKLTDKPIGFNLPTKEGIDMFYVPVEIIDIPGVSQIQLREKAIEVIKNLK